MHQFDFLLTGCVIICTVVELPYTVAIYGEHVVDATDDEFSFVVALKGKSTDGQIPLQNLIFCTGTLISERHVLTAEHCLTEIEDPIEIEVIVGSVDLTRAEIYYPESWITYDQWKYKEDNPWTPHDIAIIMLNETVYNQHVKVARLVLSGPCTRSGGHLKIAGWGEINGGVLPAHLKTANVGLLTRDECKTKARELNDTYYLYMIAQDLCTWAEPYVLGGRGDSGGPLVNEHNKVIGVNVATSPKERSDGISLEMWNSHRFNLHLSLYYYRRFIEFVLDFY